LNKLSCFFFFFDLFISASEFEMKTGTNRCRIGLRRKHERCRFMC